MPGQEEVKILVKKADGSYVHVLLSELKKKQRQNAAAVSTSSSKPASPWVGDKLQTTREAEKSEVRNAKPMAPEAIKIVPEEKPRTVSDAVSAATPLVKDLEKNLPAKTDVPEKILPTVTPKAPAQAPKVSVPSKPSAPAPSVTKEDMRSLLEEPTPGVGAGPLTSETREKQIDSIVQSLSFRPPAGNSSRLRTIIQLYIKDVRGEAETREILRRPEIEGGMGLSTSQTDEVISKAKLGNKTDVSTAPVPKPLKPVLPTQKPKFDPAESARLEKEIPAVIVKKDQVVKAPQAIIEKPRSEPAKPQPQMSDKEALNREVTKIVMQETANAPFKIGGGVTKTSMHDVKAPPLEMGPVDEIRYFSLVDFRRLSNDPLEAASRLGQKFINLKEESIVLYFEALDAWTTSPLYRDYLSVVSESLQKKVPLMRAAAGDTKRIQLPEIKALVLMEKQLG